MFTIAYGCKWSAHHAFMAKISRHMVISLERFRQIDALLAAGICSWSPTTDLMSEMQVPL